MRSTLAILAGAAIVTAFLAACSPAATSTSGDSTVTPKPPPASTGTRSQLPSCDEVSEAMGDLVTGLTYDPELSVAQTAEEAYEQRVCVFTSADAATQLGATISGIAFLQEELDNYASLPNSIADERLESTGAVLQTLHIENGPDDHLDSPLYLFDTKYSITIQGLTEDGTTELTLPLLTVRAATDAAFAVRALF